MFPSFILHRAPPILNESPIRKTIVSYNIDTTRIKKFYLYLPSIGIPEFVPSPGRHRQLPSAMSKPIGILWSIGILVEN